MKIRSIKKRGMIVRENFAKILLALPVIIVLIILAYSLFTIFTSKTELEQAKATLDKIIGKAKTLDEDEFTEILITAPNDWYLMSFGNKDSPKQCDGESCICLCEKYSSSSSPSCNLQQEDIDCFGISTCRKINIIVKAPLYSNIARDTREYSKQACECTLDSRFQDTVTRVGIDNCISFEEIPINLGLEKDKFLNLYLIKNGKIIRSSKDDKE